MDVVPVDLDVVVPVHALVLVVEADGMDELVHDHGGVVALVVQVDPVLLDPAHVGEALAAVAASDCHKVFVVLCLRP